jgi:LuxR family glucitol operon transcriptional activator
MKILIETARANAYDHHQKHSYPAVNRSQPMTAEHDYLERLLVFTDELMELTCQYTLNDMEKGILWQALQQTKLKDIRISGYSPKSIERIFAPRLWGQLSKALETKVGIKNLRLTLEKAWQESQQASEFTGDRPPLPQPSPSVPQRVTPKIDLHPSPRIIENLPAPTCTSFIGREAEINRLLELLSPDHAAHLISIDGIGGVGKTSLVVECARRCLKASRHPEPTSSLPTFEVLLFVSAKLVHLEACGLLPVTDPLRSLKEILQQIADTLEDVDLTGADLREQSRHIKKALSQRRTLLIVDNLETVENPQTVLGFLNDLPASVKVVITTREQILFVPVRLISMPEPDALALIQYESQEKGVSLTPEAAQSLFQATGGVPVAIRYVVGQLANGDVLQEVLQGLKSAQSEVARFCFEQSVHPLRGQPAHLLLIALALIPAPVLRTALVQVAIPEVSTEVAHHSLAQLRKLSLINNPGNRYSLLPLTQEYALSELDHDPECAVEIRQRWVKWYLQFSVAYAKQDAKAWRSQFDELQQEWQNLRTIADWCMAENWYSELLQLWQNLEACSYAMGRSRERGSYWGDRLTWTNWLIDAAEQRADRVAQAQVMSDRAWTLIATRKPNLRLEAETLLKQVWLLKDYQTLQFQIKLTENMAVLRIQQEEFDEAAKWLDQTEELLIQASLEDSEKRRQSIQLQYYRGMCWFKSGDMETSRKFFEDSRQQALTLQWERARRMAENWLASIAVFQGNLDEAEELLNEGLKAAEMHQDSLRMACVKKSFARLMQVRGNLLESQQWANEALEVFSSLGMDDDVEEVRAFLSNLKIQED